MPKPFGYIAVKFSKFEQRRYTYRTNQQFETGDFAVVNAAGSLKVVEVVELDVKVKKNLPYAIKWIIQRVDFDNYNKLKNS